MFPPLTEDQKALVESHLRLIGIGCHRFNFFARQIDDPEGVAALGLMQAAATFNPALGRFEARAMVKIRSALRDASKSARRIRNREVGITDLMAGIGHAMENNDEFKCAFYSSAVFAEPGINDTFPEELEGREILETYLPRLSKFQRFILNSLLEGRTPRQIAQQTNRTLFSIWNSSAYCYRKIRGYMQEAERPVAEREAVNYAH